VDAIRITRVLGDQGQVYWLRDRSSAIDWSAALPEGVVREGWLWTQAE
jgi:hypothetical protein